MGHRVFITGSGIAAEARQLLQRHDCVFENGDPKDAPADLVRKLSAFRPDGLIVRQGQINAQVMDAAGNLKVISKHGVGVDNIDVTAATQRGIPVLFTPRANFESAAEHTFALILALVRRVAVEDRRIRSGVFDKAKYDGLELTGKTLGLVGYGKIGRRLAELVAPFSTRVLVYDPCSPNQLPAHVTLVRDVAEVFSVSDILSLHCPLTAQTQGIINEQSIARMKAGVHIINTARGGLINEADLVQALRQGRVRGAALDVFETEPLAADHPLLAMDNVILTPHVAGSSDRSSRNMGVESVKNVLSVLQGQTIDAEALINKDVLVAGAA